MELANFDNWYKQYSWETDPNNPKNKAGPVCTEMSTL